MKLALIVLLALAGSAAAHPLDTAYLRVETKERTLAITFDLDVALAAQELKLEPGTVEPALGTRGSELAAKLYRNAAPRVGDTACTWGTVMASRKGVTVTLADTATCPAGDVRWDLSFGKRLATTFQILGKVIDGTGEHVITIDKTHTELAIAASARPPFEPFERSIWTGIEHVGLLPAGWHGLPAGLECLALALLLLLGGGGLQRQLIQAWMLVLGHGAGMLLGLPGMLGSVLLIMAIAAIAASVATRRVEQFRWVIVGVAGFGHGIATASSANPIGFVIGFAIAQMALAIVLGPLLGMVKRERVVQIAAVVLGAISIFGVVRWF